LQTEFFEQMRVEEIPEPMVRRPPLLQDGVEFFFRSAFNAKQLLCPEHNVALVEWSVDPLVIGKKKSVADVEEDCSDSMRHSNHSKSRRL
jgi:hypothetical protein